MSFGSFVLLPNITGLTTSPNIRASGCFIQNTEENDTHHMIVADTTSKYPLYGRIGFNASLSNTIYNNSKTVQPKALIFNYIVKY